MFDFTNIQMAKIIKVISVHLVGFIVMFVSLILLTKLIMIVVRRLIMRNLKNKNMQRAKTLSAITDDFIKYVMGIVITLTCLSYLGVDLKVLLTSVGVITLIIGIAGQALIADMLNGFFTIIEGYYDVGDYIKVNNFEGYVVGFGIKVTTLRTTSLEIITIPNSKIVEIINYSKLEHSLFHTISVAYDYDINVIEEIVRTEVIPEAQSYNVVDKVIYLGVDKLGDSSIQLMFQVDCTPDNRFAAKRVLNRQVKIIFDKNNIEIPFNQLVIHNKDQNATSS